MGLGSVGVVGGQEEIEGGDAREIVSYCQLLSVTGRDQSARPLLAAPEQSW